MGVCEDDSRDRFTPPFLRGQVVVESAWVRACAVRTCIMYRPRPPAGETRRQPLKTSHNSLERASERASEREAGSEISNQFLGAVTHSMHKRERESPSLLPRRAVRVAPSLFAMHHRNAFFLFVHRARRTGGASESCFVP